MVNYGRTIAKLRKERGLTQSELGKELNVTYQAVSKWENDLSQPDFDTMVAICKIFGVSVDEFTALASGEAIPETAAATAAPAAVEPAPVAVEPVTPVVTPSPQPVVSTGVTARTYHSLNVKYLFGLIAALVAGIGSLIFYIIDEDTNIVVDIVAAYMIFSYIALIGHECIVWDVFLGGLTKVVSMPGVIFSLDLDGILFLIIYKFIIAPLLTLLIWIVFSAGAFLLSFIMAPFVFPFKVPSIIRDTF